MTDADFKRLERKVDKLLERQYRPLWVKAGVITRLTGWNNEGMRMARDNGYIKFEKRDDGYWYDLHSLDERLMIKTA